jgi:hypothetical protein
MPLVCRASSPLQVLMMLYTRSLPITQIQIRTRGVIFGSRWRYPQLQLTKETSMDKTNSASQSLNRSTHSLVLWSLVSSSPFSHNTPIYRPTQCIPLYPQQYYSHIHTQVTSRFSLLQCMLHVHYSFLIYSPASYKQLQLQLTDFTLIQLTTSQCHFPSTRPN